MKFTFVDLFAGIGGFHQALKELGGECLFACESDIWARTTYVANHGRQFWGTDINNDWRDIPIETDIICAGFPCQPFSIAGKRKGTSDPRGNFMPLLVDIIKEKQPKFFIFENVPNLAFGKSRPLFRDFIMNQMDLDYHIQYSVLQSSDYGLPTMRKRLYIVGSRDTHYSDTDCFRFSYIPRIPLKFTLSDLFGGECTKDIAYTFRVGGRASGVKSRHNWDTYLVDGKEHRLTLDEAKKIMGFPDDFIFPISDTQAWKQIGNTVSVNVVKAIAKELLKKDEK